MQYATLTEVKQYLQMNTTTDDALLTELLDAAHGYIHHHTGRVFAADSDTTRYFEVRNSVEGDTLWLFDDLCSVTTIVNGDGTVFDANDFVTHPRNTTPYRALRLRPGKGRWWSGAEPDEDIAITGRWAYSLTPPSEIQFACLRLAAFLYRQKDSGDSDFAKVSPDGATILPARLPYDVREIIGHYRRWI